MNPDTPQTSEGVGRWRVRRGFTRYIVEDANGRVVCRVSVEAAEHDDARIAAHAHLIAAAPTMAEAIQRALNELGVPQPGYPQPVANAVEILSAALTKSRTSP